MQGDLCQVTDSVEVEFAQIVQVSICYLVCKVRRASGFVYIAVSLFHGESRPKGQDLPQD